MLFPGEVTCDKLYNMHQMYLREDISAAQFTNAYSHSSGVKNIHTFYHLDAPCYICVSTDLLG